MAMDRSNLFAMIAAASGAIGPAAAHHTYAMFDQSVRRTVSGSVARLQWANPHALIWVYVPAPGEAGKYELWKFENDSPSLLTRSGWNSASLPEGTRVTVEYFPLRDGSRGGHWVKGMTADGRELVSPSAQRRAGATR